MTRKMKDSGIEWIGEIPEDWEISSLSKIALIKTGSTPSKQFLGEVGEIDWIKTNNLKEEKGVTSSDLKIKYKNKNLVTIAKEGATLVSCIGDIGKMAFLYNAASYNQQINAVSFNNNIQPKFGFYLLYSQKEQHKSFSNGNVLQILNSVNQGQVKVAYPELKKQKKISETLDKKTDQIETIKSTIIKEIQTLENYKKSVITETVTKGLDKNVEMKDSGIEWIGEIPEHWSISRIKYLTTSRSEKGNLSDTNKYIGLENVESKTGKYIKTDTDYIDAVYDQCKKGDLLYGKLRPNLNKVLISPFDASCTGEFEIIKESTIDKKWLYYYFLTPGFTNIVNSSTFGAKMPRASWTFIENIKIAYPNDSEMQEIVSYIDSISNVTDVAICSKQKQLETLEEYKKSLIYEYVTGKKEVKDGEET